MRFLEEAYVSWEYHERTNGVATKAMNVERWLLICSCAHDCTLAFRHGRMIYAVLVYCLRFMEGKGGKEV